MVSKEDGYNKFIKRCIDDNKEYILKNIKSIITLRSILL
ncbi:hypothetical protein CNEO2_480015 [Clostridium neonatale]|nr:hypothetical protein CNEO2_350015 [Clostridium neonatale]CAI3211213.1 hypothetical protein CNEO2_480015 [Clostridium neonatale]